MTGVVFLSKNQTLCGFEVSGHSSDNETDTEGKIVCSAVSSAAYMAANTILCVLKEDCETRVDDAEMYLCVHNPSPAATAVLNGFKLHLTELAKQFGNRIKINSEV